MEALITTFKLVEFPQLSHGARTDSEKIPERVMKESDRLVQIDTISLQIGQDEISIALPVGTTKLGFIVVVGELVLFVRRKRIRENRIAIPQLLFSDPTFDDAPVYEHQILFYPLKKEIEIKVPAVVEIDCIFST